MCWRRSPNPRVRRCLEATVGLMLLVSSAWSAGGAPRWRVLEDREPGFTPRYYHAGAVYRDRLWIAGGLSAERWHNDVWSSADGAIWQQETPAAQWSPRAKTELVVHANRLFLIGGLDDESTPEYVRNDVWSSTDGREWQQVCAAAPWPGRSDFAALSFHGDLIVMGGHGANGRLNDVWASLDGATWRCLAEAAPWPPRSEFGATVHEGKLLVAGGLYFRDDLRHSFNKNGIYSSLPDVWASVDGASWVCVNERAPFGGRYGSELLSMGDHVFLMPGNEGADRPDVSTTLWASDDGAEWRALASPPEDRRFDRRINAPMLRLGDQVWVPGGVYPYWGSIRFHHHTIVLEGDLDDPAPWYRDRNPVPDPLPGEPGFRLSR